MGKCPIKPNQMTKEQTVKRDHLELITPEIMPRIEGIASPVLLYRYDKGADRYYYSFTEDGPKGYLSVTSFVGKSLGISRELYKWASGVGVEYANFYSKMRAAYGTQMHIEITEILKSGKGDFDQISRNAFMQANTLGYTTLAENWASDMVNDIASFVVFAKEKELDVIAAEFPICSEPYELAGCIDCVARVKFGKSKVNAIIDFKSGKKGFFESHEVQLHTYKTLWNDWYQDVFPVTHVFNWSPNNWKKEPTYKFKNQTNSSYADSVRNRIEICRMEGWVTPPTQHLEIHGAFDLENFELENHLHHIKIQ